MLQLSFGRYPANVKRDVLYKINETGLNPLYFNFNGFQLNGTAGPAIENYRY